MGTRAGAVTHDISVSASVYQGHRDVGQSLIPPTASQGLKPLQMPLVHNEHEANEETKPHRHAGFCSVGNRISAS